MRTVPSYLNLRKLILLLAIISAMVMLGNTLYASYQVQREQIIGNTLESNRVYARKLAEVTQNFLLTSQQQLAYSADLLASHDMAEDFMQAEARRLQESTNSFNSVLIVDQAGMVLASSPQTLNLRGKRLDSEGSRQSLQRRAPLITAPYVSATGRFLLALSHPVFDAEGRYKGYVTGTIYLRERSILQNLLGQHYYRDGSYLYVVDSKGRLLYHIEHNRIGEYVQNNPVVRAVMQGKAGAQQVPNTHGVQMLAGYAPISSVGWGVIAQRPLKSTLAPLTRLMSSVLWKVLPLSVLSLLAIWFFSRRISQPLWQLSRNVQERASGVAVGDMSGIRAWYYEAAQLKQALLSSFKLTDDRIGKLSAAIVTDPLTGLHNRRGLNEMLEAWATTGRFFAVIMMDIDHFKSVNDRFGHSAGDAVICQIAQFMRENSRESDLPFRIGGDEFMILLPDVDQDMVLQVGERLRNRIGGHLFGEAGSVTVSLGIAHYPFSAESPAHALSLADRALYTAKSEGRNRTVAAPARPNRNRLPA